MSNSEIFDSFVKIAQEKGIISNDSSEAKKKLEKTHRADSLSISDIEVLYGVKPNAPKNMEYEHNIMENAHPNSIVISPSYDKLNGLVENNNERQNIILNILNKNPSAVQTNHKYAEKQFISSLVSLANDLDNNNKEELRILADACLMQVYSKNTLKKKAALPVGIIAGVASVLGIVWANYHLPNLSNGFKQDYTSLKDSLTDFLNSSSSWGFGKSYDQELKNDVKGYLEKLKSFYDTYNGFSEIARELEMPSNNGIPTDSKLVMTEAKGPKVSRSNQAFNQLAVIMNGMKDYVDQMKVNFNSSLYKERHTEETGQISSWLEKSHLFRGNESFLGDDFNDVLNAIPPFEKSVKTILNMFEKGKPAYEEKAKKDLEDKLKDRAKSREQTPAPTKPAPAHDGVAERLKLDEDLEGLKSLERPV